MFVRTTLIALVASITLAFAAAYAGDYGAPAPVKANCHTVVKKVMVYETVTVNVPRTETYTECVTRYDHCNRPYTVDVTRTRTVMVPTQKTIAVTKYVSVPAY